MIANTLYKIKKHLTQLFAQKIYSAFFKRCFAACGNGFSTEYGLQLVGAEHIQVGDNCVLHQQCELYAFYRIREQEFLPHITIGHNCNFGRNNKITAVGNICFGDGVLTGGYVTITDNNHGDTCAEQLAIEPDKRPVTTKGGIFIGKNVWIGEKVTILGNVTIGEGAIIAANAVVTKDVPAYSIAAGIPAKVVKTII